MEKNGEKGQTKVIKLQTQQKTRSKQRRLEDPPESDYRILRVFYSIMHTSLAFLATTRVGNFCYKWIDFFLFKVQRSVEWCIPKKERQSGSSSNHNDVERPLPWVIFIPTLVYLRILRTQLSFVNIIVNGKQYTRENLLESTMSLRHYFRGLKSLAIKKGAVDAKMEQERKEARYFWKVYYFTRDLVLVGKSSGSKLNNDVRKLVNNSNMNETEAKKININKRTHSVGEESDNGVDENLTVQQMLDKYGANEENSMDDPDFDPKDFKEDSDSDEISGAEDDQDGEVQALIKDMSLPVLPEQMNGNVEKHPKVSENGVDTKPSEPENSETEYKHTNGGDTYNKENFYQSFNCKQNPVVLKLGPNLEEIYYSPIGSPIYKENMPANHDGKNETNHNN